jgi:hypothetical protein
MLLTSFVAGLTGEPGKQAGYADPRDMDHAIRIAFTVQEAQNQERFNNSFYTRFDSSPKPRDENKKQRYSAPKHVRNHSRNNKFSDYKRPTSKNLEMRRIQLL